MLQQRQSKVLSWVMGNNDYEINVTVYEDGTISDVTICDIYNDDCAVVVRPEQLNDVIEVLKEIARYDKKEANHA